MAFRFYRFGAALNQQQLINQTGRIWTLELVQALFKSPCLIIQGPQPVTFSPSWIRGPCSVLQDGAVPGHVTLGRRQLSVDSDQGIGRIGGKCDPQELSLIHI